MAKGMKDLLKELNKFNNALKSLDNTFAGAGWNNTAHPTAVFNGTKLSFAALAYLHEYGSLEGTEGSVPARKLFNITLMEIEYHRKQEIMRIVLTHIKKYDTIRKSILLKDLAEFVKGELERIMGDPSYLLDNAPSKGINTPLVDSGALKRNIIIDTGEQ